MGDELETLRSALEQLAAVADEAATREALQTVARAADCATGKARPAACRLLFGSSGASALAALERVAPSETAEL